MVILIINYTWIYLLLLLLPYIFIAFVWFCFKFRSGMNIIFQISNVPGRRPELPTEPGPTLLWRHNGHDGVSNHKPHDCLLSRIFRRRSKKTSKLRVTGLYAGNSPVNSPHTWPVTRQISPFDDVIIRSWNCHSWQVSFLLVSPSIMPMELQVFITKKVTHNVVRMRLSKMNRGTHYFSDMCMGNLALLIKACLVFLSLTEGRDCSLKKWR